MNTIWLRPLTPTLPALDEHNSHETHNCMQRILPPTPSRAEYGACQRQWMLACSSSLISFIDLISIVLAFLRKIRVPLTHDTLQCALSSAVDWAEVRVQYYDDNAVKAMTMQCNPTMQWNPPCGSPFSIDHALNCPFGADFLPSDMTASDFTAKLMWEVCHHVVVEPTLQSLSGETLHPTSAITYDAARLDVNTDGFWDCGQQSAFFDVRTHCTYLSPQTTFSLLYIDVTN